MRRSLFGSSFGSSLRSKLRRQIFLPLGFLLIPFYSSHALTVKTSNVIQGNAPYLTFDGGRTRAVDANGLLGITLSNGANYTPSNNSSSTTPIVLPVTGQSFADIGMLVPTNTTSVDLSSLIGPPYNYWGDDDGDSDVTATGSLSLSIVDKSGQTVSRSTVPEICKAPYRVTLSSTDGTLSTRYGFPNRSGFSPNSVTYYVNPKAVTVVCFSRPNLTYGTGQYAGPASMWDPRNGFTPQSTDPSLYGRNFPTTGANGLYFDLLIIGSSQPLSWSPVSLGGITVTMSNSTATSVRVTLTGPFATTSQHSSSTPDRISTPSLPQTFELVGRDNNGTPIVKYGFTLKQWFVNRGSVEKNYSNTLSWCNSLGYRMPRVKDLTNAVLTGSPAISGATPSSPANYYMRHIGSGFFTEWGALHSYLGVGFNYGWYWTSDPNGGSNQFIVSTSSGSMGWDYHDSYGLCSHP
ncbi:MULTISPECIES: hypothetical protein [unclassified Gilliamella]|uniref:hypothetical protein n=3 Tax=Gilliamella TaxID=1193503 RepID=UPI00226A47D3|nr:MULTISPECIES: hypothetical protein [unclassified Gilliamella]MCX8585623.1 hypothetical protein [Gilliamella sp. B3562]MCX8685534.1 hypothetical protein [Gilliamella sp. B2864]